MKIDGIMDNVIAAVIISLAVLLSTLITKLIVKSRRLYKRLKKAKKKLINLRGNIGTSPNAENAKIAKEVSPCLWCFDLKDAHQIDLDKLEDYESTLSNLELDKILQRLKIDNVGFEKKNSKNAVKQFTILGEGNDLEKLCNLVLALDNVFEVHPFMAFFNVYFLGKELQYFIDELEAIVEQLEVAYDGLLQGIGKDTFWFKIRNELSGTKDFIEYREHERPKQIATQLWNALEKVKTLEKGCPKQILFVDFPWDWDELMKHFGQTEESQKFPLFDKTKYVIYRWNFKDAGEMVKAGKLYTYDYSGKSTEYSPISKPNFDAVVCWHFMQHCTKHTSDFYYRRIVRDLRDNGTLILFSAVSRFPFTDTNVEEGFCDYTAFQAEKLKSKITINVESATPKLQFKNNGMVSSLTLTRKGDGDYCWEIKETNGYILKLQNGSSSAGQFQGLIYLKRKVDVISEGRKLWEAAGTAQTKSFHLADSINLTEEIEEIQIMPIQDDKLVLNLCSVPFLCQGYHPAEDVNAEPSQILQNMINALWTENPLELGDPIVEELKKYKLENAMKDYNMRRIEFASDAGTRLALDIFLQKYGDFDADGYMRLKYEDKWYVTYFPIETLITKELIHNKLMIWENERRNAGSVTHKISQRTLEKKLAKIDCHCLEKWFHHLGPSSDRVSVKIKPGEKHTKFYVLQEKLQTYSIEKQMALLNDLDVHDVMITAQKKEKQ